LALPIAEQHQLFAELEDRIAANIEQAIVVGHKGSTPISAPTR